MVPGKLPGRADAVKDVGTLAAGREQVVA